MPMHRILIAVTGLSPQVVTETVYALAHDRAQPWIPDAIHVITTRTGAVNLRLNLLAANTGWFHRLRADYQLPPIRFTESDIHVVTDATGTPLDDIRTQEDNTAAADFITEHLRLLTANPNTELHVSLAGGRKTMGYYVGYALSLLGRVNDRLSHVLISAPFENQREFYYPTPYDHPVHVQQSGKNTTVNARDAVVELAEIPFVPLRHGLPADLLAGKTSFRQAVDAARVSLGPAELTLDVRRCTVVAAGKTFKIPPAQFAMLALFAWRAQQGKPPLRAPKKDSRDQTWSRQVLEDLQSAFGQALIPDRTHDALHKGADGDYFSQTLSKLHKVLNAALGTAAAPYRIIGEGIPRRIYRLQLPAEAIRWTGAEGK